MIRFAVAAAMAAGMVGTAAMSHAQDGQSGPRVQVCLDSYSSAKKIANYKVKILWNGLDKKQFARIDLGVDDGSETMWPQWRDERLMGGKPGEYRGQVAISDVSTYPLTFRLLGFTQEAAKAFDEECRRKFCSVEHGEEGVTTLGVSDAVQSSASATQCNNQG